MTLTGAEQEALGLRDFIYYSITKQPVEQNEVKEEQIIDEKESDLLLRELEMSDVSSNGEKQNEDQNIVTE